MKELIQKRNALIEQMKALNSPDMTEEQEKEFQALESLLEATKRAIKRAEELEVEARSVKVAEETIVNESPRIQVIREENHNEKGEYRGYAPLSKGGLGEFAKDVRSAVLAGVAPRKLQELRAATGMNEGVGAEGGFLVQSDHAEELYSAAKGAGSIASKCFEITVSSGVNSTTFNQIDETSLGRGSLFGGVSAGFVGEAGSPTASKPKFKQSSVKLEKLVAAAYVTEEQAEDAAQLNSFLGVAFPTAMADELDYNLVWGNGAGVPLGVMNAGCLITVAKEGSQAADTIVGANINKMTDRLLKGPRSGSIQWLAHPNTLQQLRVAHVAGTNSDKYLYADAGLYGNDQARLAGYALAESQQAKDLGDLGDIILGDWSQYVLFRKNGIKASQSAHVAFLAGEMVFKWTLRVNGMPMHNSAVTDRHGSTTRSGFIALAERA